MVKVIQTFYPLFLEKKKEDKQSHPTLSYQPFHPIGAGGLKDGRARKWQTGLVNGDLKPPAPQLLSVGA
jgi:hypothetical protein